MEDAAIAEARTIDVKCAERAIGSDNASKLKDCLPEGSLKAATI